MTALRMISWKGDVRVAPFLSVVPVCLCMSGVAMSSIADSLLDCLASVERPGDFCVGGTRDIIMPAIDIAALA